MKLEYFKKDHPTFQLMNDVYFLGMVDDAAFEGNVGLDPKKMESDYDGILIFGVTYLSKGRKTIFQEGGWHERLTKI